MSHDMSDMLCFYNERVVNMICDKYGLGRKLENLCSIN